MYNYIVSAGKGKIVRNGLVDYIRYGYIFRNEEKIPCEVGYTDFGNHTEPTHIFIKDGITENGTHYYKETIEL